MLKLGCRKKVGKGGCKVEIAKLTVDVPLELKLNFKKSCTDRRTTMKDVVNQLVQDWINQKSIGEKGAS